jgi:hypothetical protein
LDTNESKKKTSKNCHEEKEAKHAWNSQTSSEERREDTYRSKK